MSRGPTTLSRERTTGFRPRAKDRRNQGRHLPRCQAAPRPEALSCAPRGGADTTPLLPLSRGPRGRRGWNRSSALGSRCWLACALPSPGSPDSRPVPVRVLSFWLPAGSRLFPPPGPSHRTDFWEPAALDWSVAQSLLLFSSSSFSADTWLGGAPGEGGGLMGE